MIKERDIKMYIVKFQIKNQCLHVHIYMYINCPKKVIFEAKLTMHIRTALIKQKALNLKIHQFMYHQLTIVSLLGN